MRTMNDTLEEAKIAVSSPDGLSKQGARAVMFVLLLSVLMALSAILLIMSSERPGPAAAQSLTQDVRSPA
jgi:hypothetical protein